MALRKASPSVIRTMIAGSEPALRGASDMGREALSEPGQGGRDESVLAVLLQGPQFGEEGGVLGHPGLVFVGDGPRSHVVPLRWMVTGLEGGNLTGRPKRPGM
jgi:hypothetical protein